MIAMLALCMGGVACWSNDTLFIPPTETPTPTPIPPTPDATSKYKVGQSVVVVGQGIGAVYLTDAPEPETRANRVPSASCYPNSPTQIMNVSQANGITYYEITCTGQAGWLPEAKLKTP